MSYIVNNLVNYLHIQAERTAPANVARIRCRGMPRNRRSYRGEKNDPPSSVSAEEPPHSPEEFRTEPPAARVFRPPTAANNDA
jgi:hypothetical protein